MKKYWKLLLCAAMGIGTFTACEDVPAPYNIPTENGGTNNNNTTLFDYVYYQDFLSSPGEFTQSRTDSVKWTYSSKYGAIISGYQDWDNSGNKTNKPGVTILTSSEIDLSDVDSAFVIIDQAINYAKSTIEEDHKLLIKINEEGSKAVSLPMSYDGLGNDFSYIKQYVQIPQEFMGKKVKLGLRHVAHENYSSTWEVKSLGVAKGTAPSNEAPVIEDGVGSGTMDDPYDVPTTIKLIAAGPPSAKIYTKGIVSQVDEINEQYGNATYYISNDGTTTDQLEVYRGLGLGGAKFKADGIKVGDEVIVYGQVIYYNNKTMEFTQGSELYSLNGVTASKPDTSDATEVTCAKAVELTNALEDNGTSTETYAVTGYITEVVGNVSKNQQTFWMADTKDGGKVFEAYWANLPEGVSAFKVGSKVKIIGQLMKYVKDGKVTPEIKNATVEILEEGSGDTPTPTGTEINCAKAVELTNALADGATSTETYSVTGYITEVIGEVSTKTGTPQQTFWMADTKDGGKVFEAYYANVPNSISAFKTGMKVKITGQLMKYVKDGKVTPEIKNATVEILEEGSGDTPTPTGTEINCAKAVELTNALADGATSTETYSVTGYITEVIGEVSTKTGTPQQTFWMADTKDGGKVFEAYYANVPDGVSAFKTGMKVKITGQLMKYVKDGKVTPEIKNANVVILENGDGGEGGSDPTPGGSTLESFTNGDFETWADGKPTHWSSVASNATLEQSTDAHGGSYSVLVKGASANKRMAYEEMSLAAGTYTISCWAKAATNDPGKIRIGYAKLTNGAVANTQTDYIYADMEDVPAGSWKQVSYQFELGEATSLSLLVMNNKAGAKDVLIDDFTITKN